MTQVKFLTINPAQRGPRDAGVGVSQTRKRPQCRFGQFIWVKKSENSPNCHILWRLFFCNERYTMSESTSASMRSQETLVNDIKSIITDAEDILHATVDQTGDKIMSLRARIQDRLKDAKARLVTAEAVLVDKTRAAARATDAYVHESTWQAVGVGVGVGFLLGFILSRR
jgi:ElaB/YqjD/DUF883 family membrane-anchored ribosome-binding protein